MFQDTRMWKMLTCGGDIHVATIQLLCSYHITPIWYMVIPIQLYINHCVW